MNTEVDVNVNLRDEEVLEEMLALWRLLVEYEAPLWTNS